MGSDELSREDLEEALRFVARVQAADDLDSYRREVVEGLLELIDGNIASYNELDESGRVLSLERPPIAEELLAEFAAYRDQNPLIAHHQSSDDMGPTALSDLAGAEEFHATELYRRFYSRLDVEDQIAMRLPAPPGSLIAVVVNRSHRGFNERERALLELVRPHALQSFRMAQATEASRRQIAELTHRLQGGRVADGLAETHGLSPREEEVLALLARGASTAAIAAELQISRGTVLKHVEHLREKLGVHSRLELVAKALGGD